MNGFRTREVAELVGMSPPQVRAYARTGLLCPSRGPRRAFYFTFQDLVLLRTAKRLQEADVPAWRVRRVLHALSAQLPPGRSLTEVTITPDISGLIANDQGQAWNPESGQILLGFSVQTRANQAPITLGSRPTKTPEGSTSEGFFQLACELEACAPEEAREAYRKALDLDPSHAGSHVNLGRLDQDAGNVTKAIDHYTAAIISEPDHAIARFNMASVMEHLERIDEAIDGYTEALRFEPTLSEAHYRLAVLYERQGLELDALRHLKSYRSQVRLR